jgi:hypothetical protein
MTKEKLTVRLALRVEGDFWNAYYASHDTMSDAVLMGSLLMLLTENQERKQAFIDLMTAAMADIIEQQAGQRPTWDPPKEAPFWERE